jgi:hypothetical protein
MRPARPLAIAAAAAAIVVASALPARRDASADDGGDAALDEVIARAVRGILDAQEDDGAWTYRGVYGVPIGYRVGGTSIVCRALLAAGDRADRERSEDALERALDFVLASRDDPLMGPEFAGTYDVRVWGQAYGLLFLSDVRARGPRWARSRREEVDAAIRFFVGALVRTEIPGEGGWAYSRPRGGGHPNPHASFVTASVAQALLAARAVGADVPADVLDRSARALLRSRSETGAFTYSGAADGSPGRADQVPGAVARMPVAEATLLMLGRGDVARVRAAVDAFFEHWGELEKVRKKQGAHQGPWGIAPYYFFYGQDHAAQAIELLDEAARPAYRARLRELLLGIREEDGGFNDRVFEESKAYGSAMAVLALVAKDLPPPPSLPARAAKRARPVY